MSEPPGFMAALIRHWILGFARDHGCDLQDRLPASFFDALERAVGDEETRPRTFDCAGEMTVLLRGSSLELGVNTHE